jgi:hypothetical protein
VDLLLFPFNVIQKMLFLVYIHTGADWPYKKVGKSHRASLSSLGAPKAISSPSRHPHHQPCFFRFLRFVPEKGSNNPLIALFISFHDHFFHESAALGPLKKKIHQDLDKRDLNLAKVMCSVQPSLAKVYFQ